ncbi:hypothetical protein PDN49_08415 [Bacillus cereus]|nr:hypothetical protein [Bacillus cereus]
MNKLEKVITIGINLHIFRSKEKIKQYVGLKRVLDLIKLIDELQENTTIEDKEEAL